MVFSTLFAVFNLKIMDLYQMNPERTTCFQMATIGALSSKMINVICFNYMVIAGEITPNFDTRIHTSFARLYGAMIKTPFLGDKFNEICPLLIIIGAMVYAYLGIFNYKSKAVDSLVLFNMKRENEANNEGKKLSKVDNKRIEK